MTGVTPGTTLYSTLISKTDRRDVGNGEDLAAGTTAQPVLFIDGEWVASEGERRFDAVCPSTEAVVAQVADATAGDVDRAVRAARRAFDEGPWPQLPLEERIAVVTAAAKLVGERADDVGRTITTEMGQPVRTATGITRNFAPTIDFIAEVARRAEQVRYDDGPAAVLSEPVGVVAGIAPWNAPISMTAWKILAPLIAGCTVVYKPAPETSFSVRYVVDALAEAGLPAGAVNVVSGLAETGEALASHPAVDKVSFTGSTAVGRRIGALAGEGLKRVQLELGGKSAAVVLDDADLDTVVRGLSIGSFFNTGQVCAALTRVLAPRDRYDEVVDALRAAAGRWVLGDPFDEATTLGPVAGERHRDRIESYIRGAVDAGATVALGGGRPAHLDRGWFVEPTVLTEVTNDMAVAQEEIFGPVVSVIAHDGEDDAVRIANDSDYGLHGAVFTADPERAIGVARRIRTGTFTVNGFLYNNRAPFGGVKASGIGRDTGIEGYLAYRELKTVNLPKGDVDRYRALLDGLPATPATDITT